MAEHTETTELYWPRNSRFRDVESNVDANGKGVYEVPAKHEAWFRQRGWTDAPDEYDGDVERPTTARNPSHTGPTRDEVEDMASGSSDETDAADDAADADETDGDSGN